MKAKITLFVFSFFFVCIIVTAQTINLSFFAKNNGQVVSLEKIFIENLSKACDTILFSPNTSIVLQAAGIEDLTESPTSLSVFQNTPNPVTEMTSVLLFNPISDNISVVVFDIGGKKVCSYSKKLDRGFHIFDFSLGERGAFIFSFSTSGSAQSIKVTSMVMTENGVFSIRYSGKIDNESIFKEVMFGSFVFSAGDHLRYTGYYNSMTKTLEDTPQSSKTYTFEFGNSGFTCGQNLTINHLTSGGVAPVNKTTIYSTVTNIPGEPEKCWISSNLGSDHQATSVYDTTESSAGWYWQFNRKQGYKHDGTTRTPTSGWQQYIYEDYSWKAFNDPCTLELGSPWRLPYGTEWHNLVNAGGWAGWNNVWNSNLKLHAAGLLTDIGGWSSGRGTLGYYWTGSQHEYDSGWYLFISDNTIDIGTASKKYGFSVRCIRNN